MQVYCAMSAVPTKRERSESKDAVAGLCGDLCRKSFPFQEQGRGRKVECKVCKQRVASYASAKDQHEKYSLKHIACLEWEKGVRPWNARVLSAEKIVEKRRDDEIRNPGPTASDHRNEGRSGRAAKRRSPTTARRGSSRSTRPCSSARSSVRARSEGI